MSAVCGTAIYKLSTRKDGPPRIKVIDPSMFCAYWDPDDYDDVYGFKLEWTTIHRVTGKPTKRRQLIYQDSPDSWTIVDQEAQEGAQHWTDISVETWPYQWPPIGFCQNLPSPNDFWGRPDLNANTIRLAYAVNAILSNTSKIVRLHAHPKLVGIGFRATDIDVSPDEMVMLPNPEAHIDTIEMQSDLASSIILYDKLREAYHETTRIPEVATGKLQNTGQLSGVAMAILYGPIVQKTEQKRLLYGPMVEEMLRRVLIILGHDEDAAETTWPEIVPTDPLAERQALQIDSGLGVSKSTILEKLGYDPAVEAEQRQEEGAAALTLQQTAIGAGNVPMPNGRMDPFSTGQ